MQWPERELEYLELQLQKLELWTIVSCHARNPTCVLWKSISSTPWLQFLWKSWEFTFFSLRN